MMCHLMKVFTIIHKQIIILLNATYTGAEATKVRSV